MRKLLILCLSAAALVRADVVECANGDRYHGKVLTVDAQSVKLQNEITGTLTIPRSKVSVIAFGDAKVAKVPSGLSPSGLPGAKPAETDSAAVAQVEQQLLGDATPEARQMYQEMVQGLLSGKLDLGDVRKKAQSTLDELKNLQKELGDDEASALLGSYAGILENFLNQAPTTGKPVTPPEKRLEKQKPAER